MGGLNRRLLAEWMFNAELEFREAQRALKVGEPNARDRYIRARESLSAAFRAATKTSRRGINAGAQEEGKQAEIG